MEEKEKETEKAIEFLYHKTPAKASFCRCSNHWNLPSLIVYKVFSVIQASLISVATYTIKENKRTNK